jgi:hypothetical protein
MDFTAFRPVVIDKEVAERLCFGYPLRHGYFYPFRGKGKGKDFGRPIGIIDFNEE